MYWLIAVVMPAKWWLISLQYIAVEYFGPFAHVHKRAHMRPGSVQKHVLLDACH